MSVVKVKGGIELPPKPSVLKIECYTNSSLVFDARDYAAFSNTIVYGGNISIDTYAHASSLETTETLAILSLINQIKIITEGKKSKSIVNIWIKQGTYTHRVIDKMLGKWVTNGFKNRKGNLIAEAALWKLFITVSAGENTSINWKYYISNKSDFVTINNALSKRMAISIAPTNTVRDALLVQYDKLVSPYNYNVLVNNGDTVFPVRSQIIKP